jgi:hypothetical protein
LGDIFVEPAWLPSRNVLSVGDLLLSVGLAWATYLLAAPTRRAPGEMLRQQRRGLVELDYRAEAW